MQPIVSSVLICRSRVQVSDPFSSVEYLDWLVLVKAAASDWVISEAERSSFSSCPMASFSSMYAASLADRSRNSVTVPTFQPLASSSSLFAFFISLLSVVVYRY